MENDLLIIGKRPLPIGGVTIHVERLIAVLQELGLPYCFYDLKQFSIISFIREIRKHKYAHLHSSSPVLRLLFAFVCLCVRTTSISTIHGNLGRFSFLYNLIDYMAIRISDYPIVINKNSFVKSIARNRNTLLISAYIPLVNDKMLDGDITCKINTLKRNHSFICASNASNYTLDKDGGEIYGITGLMNLFKKEVEYGFILSDPSGEYSKRFTDNSDNILIVNKPHSFSEVLKNVNCYIRNTSTDGDSLSIHEALDAGISVIATDVVDRPDKVILVSKGRLDILKCQLKEISVIKKNSTGMQLDLNSIGIISFYNNYIYS